MNEKIIDVPQGDLVKNSDLSSKQTNFCNKLAFVAAVFAINNVIYFTPGFWGVLYYGIGAVLAALAFSGGGRLRMNIEMWLLYAACWFSILMNDIPSVFRPEFRCITFMLMTIFLGPAFTSEFLASFRVNLLKYLLKGCIIISVLSFVGRFVGFSMYIADMGLWCGITAHSMLLGPIAAVAAITLLHELLTEEKKGEFLTYWRIFALIASVFCILGAASRTAIIAAMAGFLILVIKKGSIQKVVPLLLIGFIILLMSFSFVSSVWDNVAQKNKNETTLNFDSRTELWQQRLAEFKQSPFCGIGFASIEANSEGSQNSTEGTIEPGSSWLILLSMTGIVGTGAFLLLLNNTFVRISQCKQKDFACLLFALGTFWALEMCAEGFIFASGSFLFFMLWTLVGAIEGATHHQIEVAENNNLEA